MNSKGIAILEVIIVLAVTVIIFSVVILNIGNIREGQDLDLDTKVVVATLRDAQQRALNGEESSDWGVYFTNSGDNDYYEVFKGATYPGTIYTRKNFRTNVELSGPSNTVIFNRITGLVSVPFTVVIKTKNSSEVKEITVNSNGSINF